MSTSTQRMIGFASTSAFPHECRHGHCGDDLYMIHARPARQGAVHMYQKLHTIYDHIIGNKISPYISYRPPKLLVSLDPKAWVQLETQPLGQGTVGRYVCNCHTYCSLIVEGHNSPLPLI
jgi:hypothetical protein